ncbi:serine hydrolase [Ramlibacter ginsenosidimutans]|uniref:Serine hydrolase n=1 Tax=Ramlibacter ginsenosidimutans TaxID=502333 RepID=A0A934TVJ2_9BURK|nr:serine hydrolase [Ramlibacter ginsenosidimutans]MBK6007645.1 serine hydrolase [Ramlibacter ginsenosidimutans]
MERRRFASVLGGTAIAALTGIPAYADRPESCGVPQAGVDGWPVVFPDEDTFIDRAALCRMADGLVASGANIHAVLVAHRGKLVFERYFTGLDEVPGYIFGERIANVTFDAATLHNVKSVSKSVASLALGIAIDQGLVRSIDEPVFSFFPEFSDLRTPQKDRILLRHALDMTMGLQWIEATPATGDANDEVRMHLSPDPCRYVLGLPVVTPPGQAFHYNTGALALVSAVVRKAVGRPLDEFARANLFEPLGISSAKWNRVGGDTDAGGGLRLRPRDMARIGQLVLAGGRWNGRQVVSRSWIDASTAANIQATDDQLYGYLWWLGRARANRRVIQWIGALGRGGQSIRIVPELDLVVVVTAGYYQDYSPKAFRVQFGVFRDVLRAVRDL